MTSQTKRLSIALSLVAACFAVPAISTATGEAPREVTEESREYVLKNYSDTSENFAIGLYEHIAGKPTPNALPHDFEAEFFDPLALGKYEAYSGERVVGLYWGQNAGASQQAVHSLLVQTGWQHIGATEASTSYIKEDGTYRWLNIATTQSGGALSVVLNYREDV